MLNLDDRKRVTNLIQLLITIDKRTQHTTQAVVTAVVKNKVVAMPARDKSGRFIPNPAPPNNQKGEISKARKKCGPYLFKKFHSSVAHLSVILSYI